ncbi:unnamed protein product [Dibothriocephalus latus]|uniref:Uncharacterized protein n=1 Tax=Dibothriocephalus latus TaxID=60516 RepID=A0A3P7MG55_DIBLA|nr:unnamed protein product [Dibothriocephalus latus]
MPHPIRDRFREQFETALPGTGSIESVTAQLEDIFRRIAALLSEGGEEALTAYEVITSGLVNALLLCLASTRILSWASAPKKSGLSAMPAVDAQPILPVCIIMQMRAL